MGFINKILGRTEKQPEPVPEPPAPPEPEAEPEPIQVNQISPEALKSRLDNGDDLLVIDMRQGWEYQSGHIPGATHMFIQEIPLRFKELPKDKDIVFQCWHGNTSLDASGFLIQNGWDGDRVFSLSGGIAGWAQAFGPEGLVKD